MTGGGFFFQAEDGIRDLVRSRGLGDVYKRQRSGWQSGETTHPLPERPSDEGGSTSSARVAAAGTCLLYTSDAADERSSVDLGGRRIIKKKRSTEDDERYGRSVK